MSKAPIRVLVVDDHPVVADGVQLLLRDEPSITVAGSARSGEEALRLVAELVPDVVLLDQRLPDMLGSAAIPALRARVPGLRVVLFTAYAGQVGVRTALASGADGCLLKDTSITDLAAALHQAADGVTVIDPRLRGSAGGSGKTPNSLAHNGLTRREYDVLQRVALGRTNPEIAEDLGISRNTVKTYLQTVMGKLGARNRVEAIAKAGEAHLL
jgi:DNA-binding NarL/FixJ family response regulator